MSADSASTHKGSQPDATTPTQSTPHALHSAQDIAGHEQTQNTRVLKELQQNEQQLTDSLREQLNRARKDKANLEADLASRAKAFQATLDKLHTSQSDDVERLMAILDSEESKKAVKALYDKCVQQEARIKKLEFDLEMEQGHVNILRHDNQLLRQMTVDMTALAEQEEEYISNKLLKRISGLKKEKGELLMQVEQEEEYMTNMLQKKLNQLQKEKIDMENALEQEQEYIVNKLQKQLDSLRSQQPTAQSPSRSMQDVSPASLPVSPVITGPMSSPSLNAKKWLSSHSSADAPPPGLVEVLRAEITALKSKTAEMEKEYLAKMQQCNKYKSELVQLRRQLDLPVDDLPADEGIPAVFRSVPPSPGRQVRARRSTSTSSQRSITSDKTNVHLNSIPPLQLDNSSSTSTTGTPGYATDGQNVSTHSSISPVGIPEQSTASRSRSESMSSTSGSLPRREVAARRISGGLFGLNSPPPQHPPHP